ncbi:MAG: VWA domain-containing protein [Lachnospiraceae bacterium]|nr:VWA domain-containing protein [Lachnospiraceae bacterium]
MKLLYPWIIAAGVVVLLVLSVFGRRAKAAYKEGKKVANTDFIEETELYQKLKRQYHIFSAMALFSLFMAIFCGFVLLSRPAKVEQVNTELRNRDIFLCMDISSSVDELNVELCEELKEVVKQLDGERFGITIFNAKSVLLVPLTDDYEYVIETLDKLLASLKLSIKLTESDDIWDDDIDWELYDYKYEGTLSEEGSSLIGDGLASCLYNFSDLTENSERSRMIIFTTDNELNGTPFVTLEEATKLCKKNKVKVFAIAPENVVDEDIFQSGVESTGGKFYKSTSSRVFDELIDDIEETETSKMNKVETFIYDQPQIVFLCMVIFMGLYFVLSRKVKL